MFATKVAAAVGHHSMQPAQCQPGGLALTPAWARHFDIVQDPLAVKFNAAPVPPHIAERIEKLVFPHDMPGRLEQLGFDFGDVNMFMLAGTMPLHTDDIELSATMTLGLILKNDADFHLTDGVNRLPLPEGTIYRIDPRKLHGTCLRDGSPSTQGRLLFLTVDYHSRREYQTPGEIADWIYESVDHRLRD